MSWGKVHSHQIFPPEAATEQGLIWSSSCRSTNIAHPERRAPSVGDTSTISSMTEARLISRLEGEHGADVDNVPTSRTRTDGMMSRRNWDERCSKRGGAINQRGLWSATIHPFMHRVKRKHAGKHFCLRGHVEASSPSHSKREREELHA